MTVFGVGSYEGTFLINSFFEGGHAFSYLFQTLVFDGGGETSLLN